MLVFLFQAATLSLSYSQTCCSGGVPLSGNIGFEGSDKGTFQMEMSYDVNYLSTLKNGSERYADDSRRRVTNSILLKSGYSFSKRLAVDALISYVVQNRRITYFEQINKVQTSGMGDAVVIMKYIVSRIADNGYEVQLGAGPKIPLGKSDLAEERGITLNADLQPGSGTWDLITWGIVVRQMNRRPTAKLTWSIVGRINGTNENYLGSQAYQFGNSFQTNLGIGDQFSIKDQIVSTTLSVRYRKAIRDRINGFELDNTGGQWINVLPSFGWHIRQNTIVHIAPEIPVYSWVEGVQLTPAFRLQVGLYHTFGKENKYQQKEFQL